MATPKHRKPRKAESFEDMERRTHQEDSEQLTDDEVRRQLGFDLLPINGGDRGVQD